jgi:hypothetical protein
MATNRAEAKAVSKRRERRRNRGLHEPKRRPGPKLKCHGCHRCHSCLRSARRAAAKLRGIAMPFLGSKKILAEAGAYPAPLHRIIIEPFAGMAGYSVHWCLKGRCDRVILAEANELGAAALRWWLLEAKPDEIRQLWLPLGKRERIDGARARPKKHEMWLKRGHDFPDGKKEWFTRAVKRGFYGEGSGGATYNSAWGQRHGAQFREALALQLSQLHRSGAKFDVMHFREHGSSLLESLDSLQLEGPATIFVDPPYSLRKGGDRYGRDARTHCGRTDIDYARLGQRCQELRAAGHQVIVCEGAADDSSPGVAEGNFPQWMMFELCKVQKGASHKCLELIN